MKTVTIKIPITKVVKSGFKEKTVYETEDGKQFPTEKQALNWEKQLEYSRKFSAIKTFDLDEDILYIGGIFYYASNEEELKIIVDYFRGLERGYKIEILGDLKVGEWITADINDYDSDNGRKTSLYTLSYIKQEIQRILKSFEDKK